MAAQIPAAKPVEIVKPARKARAKAPENESKSDKFKRLANFRVPRLIKLLKAIGNLGNAATYESTKEQRDLITGVIDAQVKACKEKLAGGMQLDNGFKL